MTTLGSEGQSFLRSDLCPVTSDAVHGRPLLSRCRAQSSQVRTLAIESNEIGAELLVDRFQIFRQVPADSELCGQFAALIADDWEAELVVALGLSAVSGRLLRHSHERCTTRFDFGPRLLERLKIEIAERTPGSAIERQDEWAFGQ
jgi:hypothetical protein